MHVSEGSWVACEVRHHRYHSVDIDISISANTVINDGLPKDVVVPFSEGKNCSGPISGRGTQCHDLGMCAK
jgi:hypothetical protein